MFKKIAQNIILWATLTGLLLPAVAFAARTDALWDYPNGSNYMKPNGSAAGLDILIFGTNKYLNWGAVSGVNGYGIRDNGGVMEFKNSGGSWVGLGTGGGGAGSTTTINGIIGPNFTFITGSSGTDFNVATSGTNIIYNLPTASAVNTGKLSNLDWIRFDNVANGSSSFATTSGLIANYVPYNGANSNINLGTFGLTTSGFLNATSSLFTSASTTNFFVTNASSTNATSSNFFAVSARFNNATATNFFGNVYPTGVTNSIIAADPSGKLIATTTAIFLNSLSAIYPLIYNSATGVFASAISTTTFNLWTNQNNFQTASSSVLTAGSLFATSSWLFSANGTSTGLSTFATSTTASSTTSFLNAISLFFNNATGTSLFVTNASTTNSTSTNLFSVNGNILNGTSSNFFSTNASTTNSTSTNFFSVLANILNATTSTFFTTLGSSTLFRITNASTTNLSLISGLYDSLNATGTVGQYLISTGTSTKWTTVSAGVGCTSVGSAGTIQYASSTGGACDGTSTFAYVNSRLGIGTSTPLAIVHILSSLTNLTTLATQATTSQTAPVLDVWSSTGSSLMNVQPTGLVGIGTSTPLDKLSIVGSEFLSGAFKDSTSATGTLNQVLVSTGTSTQWVGTSSIFGAYGLLVGNNNWSGTNAFSNTVTVPTKPANDNSTNAASTAYVDAAGLAQNYKEAAKYASTAALPAVIYANGASGVGATLTGVALGAISLDGNTPSVGDRVLIKNQASTFQNGIYTVTTVGNAGVAFVLTRSVDANQSNQYKTGDLIFITTGATQSATTWAYTGIDSPTMGTDAITYSQIAGQGSFTATYPIILTGTVISTGFGTGTPNNFTAQNNFQTASTSGLTAGNLFATSSILFTGGFTFGNATGTNLFVTNASTTNATSSNFFTVFENILNGTTTNFFATNASSTNATSSNFFAVNENILNGTTTNLFATNASTTNLKFTNASSTGGLTATNIFGNIYPTGLVNSLLSVDTTGKIVATTTAGGTTYTCTYPILCPSNVIFSGLSTSSPLVIWSGTTTLATTTVNGSSTLIGQVYMGLASSTALTASSLYFTNATGTSLFVTNASSTNATSSLFFAINSILNNATSTNFFTTTGSSSLFRITNASTTNLTLVGSLYDSTNALGTLGQVLQATGTSTQWITSTGITGGGAKGKLAVYSSGTNIVSGITYDNGVVAGINATTSTSTFNIQGTGILDVFHVASSSGASWFSVKSNGFIGIGTSTPIFPLSVASGTIAGNETVPATSTSMTIDWRNGNQQLIRIGASATTIVFANATTSPLGATLRIVVCNGPGTAAGAISWSNVYWPSGTAPTQTTAINRCDVWSFLTTRASSTNIILGNASLNF